jgi:hypothetical protein
MIRALRPTLSAIATTILALTIAGFALAQEQAGFFSNMDDLPVMSGLTEVVEAGMVFDSSAGRIVEAFATGRVAEAEIIRFYAETLPQLGWAPSSRTTYSRDGEVLTLELQPPPAAGQPLGVRFSLSPAGP